MLESVSKIIWMSVRLFSRADDCVSADIGPAEGGQVRKRVIDLDVDIGADAVDYK